MTDVTIDHLAAARADGSLVLDVREPFEYVTGHVPGALLMPVSEVPAGHRELPQGRTVYVICASGNRSRRVTDLLRGRGYDARSVLGGTSAWVSAGQPVVVGPHRES
jgi:rhodanese-related sulfurtransferase